MRYAPYKPSHLLSAICEFEVVPLSSPLAEGVGIEQAVEDS